MGILGEPIGLGRAELRQRRRALGLTQAELAARLDVTSNTVARWERGEVTVGKPARVARLLMGQLARE